MAVRFVLRTADAKGRTLFLCADLVHDDFYLSADVPEEAIQWRDLLEATAMRSTAEVFFPGFTFEIVKLQGSLRLAKLPPRFQWTLHNLVAHPVSEVLYQLGFEKLSDKIHDRTIPLHEAGEGRG